MGLDGHLVRWISDYLTDRKQFVVINGVLSLSPAPKISVPQGFVLSPVLFNIYLLMHWRVFSELHVEYA